MSRVMMSLYDPALRQGLYTPVAMGYYDRPDMLATTDAFAPAHRHNLIEIMYVIDGRADIIFKGEEVNLAGGALILIDSMVVHALRLYPGEKCSMLNIEFAFEKSDNEGLSIKSMASRHQPFGEMLQMKERFIYIRDPDGSIFRLLKQNIAISDSTHAQSRRLSSMLTDMTLLSIAANLIRSDQDLAISQNRYVDEAKRLMRQAEASEISSVSELAGKLGISASYLIRLFKRDCGVTPKQYALGIKLDGARKLLEQSDYSVIHIATSVGLSSERNFARLFKKRYGDSPSVFRKKTRTPL